MKIPSLAYTLFAMALFFWLTAATIFMWRNPKANSMSAYREFKSVMRFEKLDTFQK